MPDLSRRIRDAAGLLAHVPTMLKFQPNDSLVVLVMSSRQVVLTVRLDLADTALFVRIVELNEAGEFPAGDPTDLEAGANRCAVR